MIAVGVPKIVPFDEPIDRPAGRDGEIDQESTDPPPAFGVTDVISEPTVRVKELGL